MKKKKKPQQQVAEILLEYLTGVYVGFMLLIFPLVFHNAYFDIFTTKRYTYLVATSAFLIFAAVLLLVLLAQRSLKLTERIGKPVLCFAGPKASSVAACAPSGRVLSEPESASPCMGSGARIFSAMPLAFTSGVGSAAAAPCSRIAVMA